MMNLLLRLLSAKLVIRRIKIHSQLLIKYKIICYKGEMILNKMLKFLVSQNMEITSFFPCHHQIIRVFLQYAGLQQNKKIKYSSRQNVKKFSKISKVSKINKILFECESESQKIKISTPFDQFEQETYQNKLQIIFCCVLVQQTAQQLKIDRIQALKYLKESLLQKSGANDQKQKNLKINQEKLLEFIKSKISEKLNILNKKGVRESSFIDFVELEADEKSMKFI